MAAGLAGLPAELRGGGPANLGVTAGRRWLWPPRQSRHDPHHAPCPVPVDGHRPAAQTPALSLERITADPPLAGRLPRQAEISPGGQWVSFLRPSAGRQRGAGAVGPQPSSRRRRHVKLGRCVRPAWHCGPATQRGRKDGAGAPAASAQRGITGYQWCGKADDSALLFPLSGDLYLRALWAPAALSGPAADPHSPDATQARPALQRRMASRLAYVHGRQSVRASRWTGKLTSPRQLTTDGSRHPCLGSGRLHRRRGAGAPARLLVVARTAGQLLALRVDESGVGGEDARADLCRPHGDDRAALPCGR